MAEKRLTNPPQHSAGEYGNAPAAKPELPAIVETEMAMILELAQLHPSKKDKIASLYERMAGFRDELLLVR